MKGRTALAALALAGFGIYRYRRSLLARILKLPSPRFGVRVERDLPVSMPDGVRLFTDHYFPKAAGDFPTILIRTPYGRGREDALGSGYPLGEIPAQLFAERGYHVIVQGVRGCFDSEGDFRPHANEAQDGQAAVDWIAHQPWFNGALGTWGPSYLGYAQWATAAAAPAHLNAMLVMIASSENYSVSHPDGAFGLETRLRWSQGVRSLKRMHRLPLRDKLSRRLFSGQDGSLRTSFDHLPLLEADVVAAGEPICFYRDILTHDQSDDAFWSASDHSDAVAHVTAPVHLIGGWYDYYLRGLLRDYAALKAAGRQPHLTIGPWFHAHPGGLMAGLRDGITWFDAQLKGDRRDLRQKPVRIYLMGADEWRDLDGFPPPARETRYYLRSGARLATVPPAGDSPPDGYCYDPADPTPAVGGALLAFQGAGPQDNRCLEARSDVLSYTTAPLDRDLDIIGPVQLELFARASLPCADFFGRLCDVTPDGQSTNVCDGLFRIEPAPGESQPDVAHHVEVDMWATAYRFRERHRLRLQVSSGAHPRWSRNLGTGEAVATGVRMVATDQTVYHDAARPSALVLPVVSAG
jgi:putative CocE/NonD family hydrolase